MTTVGLRDTSTYTTTELVSCLVVSSTCAYGSDHEFVFIRSASAKPLVLHALNPQDGSNSSSLMNRPGMSGDSTSWEGWSHVRWFVEEVSAGAA
jgi:hypothetical protein